LILCALRPLSRPFPSLFFTLCPQWFKRGSRGFFWVVFSWGFGLVCVVDFRAVLVWFLAVLRICFLVLSLCCCRYLRLIVREFSLIISGLASVFCLFCSCSLAVAFCCFPLLWACVWVLYLFFAAFGGILPPPFICRRLRRRYFILPAESGIVARLLLR